MTTRHGGRENSWDPRELRAVVRTAQFFVNPPARPCTGPCLVSFGGGHGAQSGGAITRECSHPRSSAALRLCSPPGGPVCLCVLCVCVCARVARSACRRPVRPSLVRP